MFFSFLPKCFHISRDQWMSHIRWLFSFSFLNCLYSVEMTISHTRPLLLFNVAPITQSARVSPVSEYLESTCEPTLCWFSCIQMIKDWGQQPFQRVSKPSSEYHGSFQKSLVLAKEDLIQNLSVDHLSFPKGKLGHMGRQHFFLCLGFFQPWTQSLKKDLSNSPPMPRVPSLDGLKNPHEVCWFHQLRNVNPIRSHEIPLKKKHHYCCCYKRSQKKTGWLRLKFIKWIIISYYFEITIYFCWNP